ncbi:MAG: hypothetical protein DDT26_01004 [Dehalococcoidia bacterium]|nr:hypothetical protein [Chloroflexota bacterium]
MADIVRMIGTRINRDAKVTAEEGSAKLGYHFFHGVGIVTKAFAEGAREAMLGTGPMGQLVQEYRVPAFGRATGLRAREAETIRHRDAIGAAIVVRTRATDVDDSATCGNQLLGTFTGRDGVGGFVDLRHGVAINLGNVEHARRAGDEAAVATIVIAGGIAILLARLDVLVEDDNGGLLALADLGAFVLPLAIRAPQTVGEFLAVGGSPEGNGVDAAIGTLAGNIDRAFDDRALRVLGHLRMLGTGFDGGNDLVGDGVVNVEAFV